MEEVLRVQGRDVSPAELLWLREFIEAHPGWSRRQFSLEISQRWEWRNAQGRLKDMSARLLLNKLAEHGLIKLPAKRSPGSRPGRGNPAGQPELDFGGPEPEPIAENLRDLRPIELVRVERATARYRQLAGLLQSHHYLGFRGWSGHGLAYLVYDRHDRVLGCVLYAAAAWKCRDRDAFIGWGAAARERGLGRIVNNSRFLILPHVRVAHLASHVLSKSLRALREDWARAYRYEVVLAETFVQRDRFRGTCYQASNWQHVGHTRGRGRDDRANLGGKPIKDIYVFPLCADFRERLGE